MPVTIIVGLLVLSVLVLAHELGHFIAARAAGVKVEEFGLGYPPRLFGKRRGETLFSLNAIPFGGFNRLSGEEDPAVPGSLAGKSIGTRLLVLSAGSLVNILLPLLLFMLAFMLPHNVLNEQIAVEEVSPGSPAAVAGIEPGDTFLEINGRPVSNINDLHRFIQLNLGKETTILVERTDKTIEQIKVVPRWKPPEGQGAIGVKIRIINPTVVKERMSFPEAVSGSATRFADTFVLYLNGLIGTFSGTASGGAVIGPVGIVQVTGEVAKTGISPLLEFSAIISLIVGIVNLFPIPAMDGGRIVFVLLEWIRRGKRVAPQTEGRVHVIGFIILMALLMAVTYGDVTRIISRGSPLP